VFGHDGCVAEKVEEDLARMRGDKEGKEGGGEEKARGRGKRSEEDGELTHPMF
jgi:hypothetical protein